MKRFLVVFCLAISMVVAFSSLSAAAPVGSPNKSGSVLIFPLIDISGDRDTEVSITNNYYYGVEVVCWYRSSSDELSGVSFYIRGRETAWFSAATGEGSVPSPLITGEKGELSCWAVDASGAEQISWNYLQGSAQIYGSAGSWGYSSWNFAADQPRGKPVGTGGEIRLSGKPGEYDAMPMYLSFNLTRSVTEAKVTLIAGKQDFRQEHNRTYSKAKFEYTRIITSSTDCIEDMVQTTLRPNVIGSFRVRGIASTVCDRQFGKPYGTTQYAPLLGVLEARRNSAVFGIMPVGVSSDETGYILWDAGFEPIPQAAGR